MKYFFLLLSVCFAFTVSADISNIPPHDINKIKCFFEDLIADHDFSYALFGSKPMSLADYGLKIPKGLPIHKRIRAWYRLLKRKAGLNAWYKYREEFELKDFIFLDEENDWIKDCLVLVLINKKNMLRVLQDNTSIFKAELGQNFSPESFLNSLEKREVTLATAINHNQKLMGIMLGYGTRNSTLFQERFALMKAIWKHEKENLPEDKILKQRLEDIESQTSCFSELEKDAVIHPLYFMADHSHPETTLLKQKYEQERQHIIELRRQSNFLDIVLHRLG